MKKLALALSILFAWTVKSEAKTYTCHRLDGSWSYQLIIQPPTWLSGQYIKFLDMNDGFHGPTYPYEGTLVDAPEGVPAGTYVFTRISGLFDGLGLIIDSELYNGSDTGTVATTSTAENYSVQNAFNCSVD